MIKFFGKLELKIKQECFGEVDSTVNVTVDELGVDTIGVYRPSIGTWFLADQLGFPVDHSIGFGTPEDIPVIGDWD